MSRWTIQWSCKYCTSHEKGPDNGDRLRENNLNLVRQNFASDYDAPAERSEVLPKHALQNFQKSSSDTIVDEEDFEAQKFFRESYLGMNEEASLSISKAAYDHDFFRFETGATPFSSSQVSLNNRETPQNRGSLPINFKMRKSTIGSGPMATDERILIEAEKKKESQHATFDEGTNEKQSYTLKSYASSIAPTFAPPLKHSSVEKDPITNNKSESQDFTFRRIPSSGNSHSIPSSFEPMREPSPTPFKSPPLQNSTPPREEIRNEEVIGSARIARKTTTKLDLPIPAPPIIVTVGNIKSIDEDVEDHDEDEDLSDEDSEAVVLTEPKPKPKNSSNAMSRTVDVASKQDPKNSLSGVKGIRKLPNNSFFSDEGTEKAEVDVEPFKEEAVPPKREEKQTIKKQVTIVERNESEKEAKVDEDEAVAPAVEKVSTDEPTELFATNPKPFSRIPVDHLLKCRVVRKTSLWDKVTPTFYLYNEVDDKFLLAARKQIKTKVVHYVISTSMDDLSKDSTYYIAKLKANFARTNFILYDARYYKKNAVNKGLKELACVSYSKTILPREIRVAIPAISIEENSENASNDIMADIKSANREKLLFLKNKAPRWNEATQTHCLNFGGRVTQPSVKNFQLIGDDIEKIILQFGRCGPDLFSMDARYPMTPVEAFAVALSTFDAYDSA